LIKSIDSDIASVKGDEKTLTTDIDLQNGIIAENRKQITNI